MSSGYSGARDTLDGGNSLMDEPEDNNRNAPSLADFLLLLLYANNKSPIKGSIMFMKQAFIIVKEIAPKILQHVDFFAYKWGPYSDDVAEVLRFFLKTGLMEPLDDRNNYFVLTGSGEERVAGSLKRIPQDLRMDVENLKRTTEEVGLKRFLEFIYVNYPLYSSRSWGKDKLC